MEMQEHEQTRELGSTRVFDPAEAPEKNAGGEPEEPQSTGGKEAAGSLFSDIMDIFETIITSVFVMLMIFTFLVCIASVEGTSMVPTLSDKDRLLVTRAFNEFETGDILIIQSDHAFVFDEDGKLKENPGLDKRIVKRLIAQGGQEVNIDFDEGAVYVDGKKLDEPYINVPTHRNEGAFNFPITVPKGYVFVLGDNRGISRDSRDPNVGLIPLSDVLGEVRFRIAPLSGFGTVE
ncbi:MAG: signal peptidase I [Oscillospiraceae bacterium]|nr:signal peptidase I [Oscillospiraceae bacterium]